MGGRAPRAVAPDILGDDVAASRYRAPPPRPFLFARSTTELLTSSSPPSSPPVHYLVVVLVQAAGLIAMDQSFFNKKGRSDPYVKITAEHVVGKKERTEELGKTTTKKRTLSPMWDEVRRRVRV